MLIEITNVSKTKDVFGYDCVKLYGDIVISKTPTVLEITKISLFKKIFGTGEIEYAIGKKVDARATYDTLSGREIYLLDK